MVDRFDPIMRTLYQEQELVDSNPPVFRDRNKRLVFEIACPEGTPKLGRIGFSRWKAMPLPEGIVENGELGVVGAPGFFDYEPVSSHADAVEWHVNFADPDLLFGYGSRLFAQDEMQVAEHPALASLREELIGRGVRCSTTEDGQPTPVLVIGAPRRCRLATDPDEGEGRPLGLYGRAFSSAGPTTIRRATKRIDPPTTTHLIAIAAPSDGFGPYTVGQIEKVLVTAFTGFRAAVIESGRMLNQNGPVVVHTGFWGCGAFGGDRVLMSALQMVAAATAGVHQVVFHTGDPSGAAPFSDARRVYDQIRNDDSVVATSEWIRRIHSLGFRWGRGDGN